MLLSNLQFDRTRRLALSLAGIGLVDRHRELLARRSRHAGILDSAGLDSLLGAAEAGEVMATQTLLCWLTTKFTAFFRHPRHLQATPISCSPPAPTGSTCAAKIHATGAAAFPSVAAKPESDFL